MNLGMIHVFEGECIWQANGCKGISFPRVSSFQSLLKGKLLATVSCILRTGLWFIPGIFLPRPHTETHTRTHLHFEIHTKLCILGCIKYMPSGHHLERRCSRTAGLTGPLVFWG